MDNMRQAVRAYATASATRSVRTQEAEVFLNVNARLKRALDGADKMTRIRALADNDRLWMSVIGLVRDPANALPSPLRASLVSVGLAVQREMKRDTPDLRFLLHVNENIAGGLERGS